MLDYLETCRKIHRATRESTIIVFAIQGDIYFFPAGSKRSDVMLKDFPNSLVGIYDDKCSLKYLMDDIL
jgi:hypothetical protein